MVAAALGAPGAAADDAPGSAGNLATATPIKHVIVIIGENRSFDHLFGLYRPRAGQTIANLLSKGILNADGSPGPHFTDAAQSQAAPQTTYFIGAATKQAYATLPPPDLHGLRTVGTDDNPVPSPIPGLKLPTAFATADAAARVERDLPPDDIRLMATGMSGLATREGPDTRVANALSLPNGPFRLTGPDLPYDAYTGDTVHRFFQMWQQSDCVAARATRADPSGCRNDLYPWVATHVGKTNAGGGSSMGVYDMAAGDVPYLKRLADTYTLADNYHQPAMGGTMIQHHFLGAGDALFYSDDQGRPAVPPKLIANPDPMPGTVDQFTLDGGYTSCADRGQPGIAPILDYLAHLPRPVKANCEPGHYYVVNNLAPAWKPDGSQNSGDFVVPPSHVRTIADALAARRIGFAFYGGGLAAAAAGTPATYCTICNPWGYDAAMMSDPAVRAAHWKDVQDFLAAIARHQLPAVAYVKPDGWLDGHPESSKVDLFEAFAGNLVSRIEADPALFADTAIFITFDKSGGYWDSGYMQPLDFFGDGPRIPLLVISPYSKGGRVVHSYTDHVSILKFIERNWHLPPLTNRSRDRLPNPKTDPHDPYVPVNSPAIGDLFDMFQFKGRS